MKIKIIIADDHAILREGIKKILESDGLMEVIGQASNGVECLDLIEKMNPDVLLLDINMPEMNGIEVLKNIRNKNLNFKTLILTGHNEIEYLIKAIEIGVDAYIFKELGSIELIKAINIIMNDEIYIQPNIISYLRKKNLNREIDKEKIKLLTKRELEVLYQVASGFFNKEIATNLEISERTVKNHISSIFRKIDVNDRTQAAVFAIKNDIVQIY